MFHAPGASNGQIIRSKQGMTNIGKRKKSSARDAVGTWEVLPYDSQIEAVHMAMLPTGKVLYYSGWREQDEIRTATRVWDPRVGNIKNPGTPEDIFCAGHSFLPDGRLLSTGGTLELRSPVPGWLSRLLRPVLQPIVSILSRLGVKSPVLMTGHTVLYVFDPYAEAWEFAGDMPEGRWYPTNTTLPNGEILILSGRNEAGGVGSKNKEAINMRVEVFHPSQGVRQVATIPEMPMEHKKNGNGHHGFPSLYPRIHVLPLSEDDKAAYPEGKAFCSGYGPETKMLNLQTWKWKDVDNLNGGMRHDGCSVLLPLHPPDYRTRILTCGGSDQETEEYARGKNTAELIDFSERTPKWKAIDPMREKRMNATSVILPDGNILVAGGNQTGLFRDPAYTVELFLPDEEKWTQVAPISVARGYHATAVLLPDGRVLLSGTTPWGQSELRMEVYSPYYLFKGERPAITNVAQSISYDQSFEVNYKCKTGSVESAVVIRLGSMTHAFDMDQRYIELEINQKRTDRMTVKAPRDAHVAPPGFYMLFLLSDEGVPSEAEFVQLLVQPQP